jgi:hypothetical protein
LSDFSFKEAVRKASATLQGLVQILFLSLVVAVGQRQEFWPQTVQSRSLLKAFREAGESGLLNNDLHVRQIPVHTLLDLRRSCRASMFLPPHEQRGRKSALSGTACRSIVKHGGD